MMRARVQRVGVLLGMTVLSLVLVPVGAVADVGVPRDITPAYESHEACIVVVEALAGDVVVLGALQDRATTDLLRARTRAQRLAVRLERKDATIARLRARIRAGRR